MSLFIKELSSALKIPKLFYGKVNKFLRQHHIYDLKLSELLVIFNVGDSEVLINEIKNPDSLFVGENPSYTIDLLFNKKYIVRRNCDRDKRGVYIKLSSKGNDVYKVLQDYLETEEKTYKIYVESRLKGEYSIYSLENFLLRGQHS